MGAGQVGRHLATSLSTRPHEITVIDHDETLAEELRETLDVGVVCGNGGSVTTLAQADVPECDLFLSLTQNDSINLVSACVSKALGAKRAVTRIHPEIQREEWLFNYRERFDIDYLFSAERLTAVELFKSMRNPHGFIVEDIARGQIEIQQIRLETDAAVLGRELRNLELPERVRVAMIERSGDYIFPTGEDRLESGDLVTLCGRPFDLDKILNRFRPERGAPLKRRRKVIIFGGGEYGFSLAQMLEGAGAYDVRIMESDKARCEEIARSLNRTVVLHGDATSQQQLREEQIGEVDFFVATSLDDEDNVMSCLQARHQGAKYCLAIVHRSDYAEIISTNQDQLGILAAVSPRVVTSRDLLRFVSAEPYHEVVNLHANADILQLTLPENSEVIGRRVADVNWPTGCGLVGALWGQQARVPTGNDELRSGDVLYLIASPKARSAIKNLFIGR